jgi:hypothetical protein
MCHIVVTWVSCAKVLVNFAHILTRSKHLLTLRITRSLEICKIPK